ncbi:D-alanine--D-alanine ligase [Desulfofalx alkaliphila]|uniref:D-alanine--D-alanine ligase n=1 Tax=Desulfofalx alkaliphila TaxID=105483 RepID=UPI0004E133A2|nr:D-alanine--D-alanine ligase [Desulfofalx alkaliphila]
MPITIGVLYGGKSAEREVSLKSGEAVFQALKSKGYKAIKIDTGDPNFIEEIKANNIDLAFLALHGTYGEDGTIQGLLELLQIPYTGSGVLSSAVAMDKIATKKLLLFDNISTPDFCTYTKHSIEKMGLEQVCNEIVGRLSLPVVVKAPTQGSTIGIYFVNNIEELPEALENALNYDSTIMVEKFIAGTEVTVTVMGNEQARVLPQIEIVSATGVYDYHAKYTVGMSEHIIPPRLTDEVLRVTEDLALRTYTTLGCSGLARVDFIISPEGRAYVLEINTIPGMTETSLVPDSARAAGIGFAELVEEIVKLAFEKHNKNIDI